MADKQVHLKKYENHVLDIFQKFYLDFVTKQ